LSEPERLELDHPRLLGTLFRDTLRIYFRHMGVFAAIGLAVVLPAEAIVSGIGLERFSSGFDVNRPVGAELMSPAVQALVMGPLIAAMVVTMVLTLAKGERPRAGKTIQAGLDRFAAVFVPVLAGLALEALAVLVLVVPLALAVESFLVPTLVIPIILAVRWYFAPQAVVAGGERGTKALRASWDLTGGSSWRVFGTLVLGYLAFSWIATLLATPVLAGARSADSGTLIVAFNVIWQSLALPAIALFATLLYFDVRARRRGAGHLGGSDRA
jgi:hypothetical protein